jgi:alpha/beta superfamily hydrolase
VGFTASQNGTPLTGGGAELDRTRVRGVLACDVTTRDGAGVTAVLLHPHPDYGGDRFHPVVDTLYRGLPVSTLRFDFRSADPAAAGADVLEAIGSAPDAAVVLMGYSFGADIALSVGDPRVRAWFAVAAPLRVVDAATVPAGDDPRPKQLLVPELDQFSAPTRTAALTAAWRATSVVTLPGADHFLVGRSGPVLEAARGWLAAVLGADGMA